MGEKKKGENGGEIVTSILLATSGVFFLARGVLREVWKTAPKNLAALWWRYYPLVAFLRQARGPSLASPTQTPQATMQTKNDTSCTHNHAEQTQTSDHRTEVSISRYCPPRGPRLILFDEWERGELAACTEPHQTAAIEVPTGLRKSWRRPLPASLDTMVDSSLFTRTEAFPHHKSLAR